MSSTDLRKHVQLSVVLINKPGTLARVVQALAEQKVNILALSMMDSTEHGVLRLVLEDIQRAKAALAQLDLPLSEQEVLVATLPNRAGALADVVGRLAAEHMSVHYAYCTTGAPGGKTLGVFKVDNVAKAMQVLEVRKPKRSTELSTAAVRTTRRAKR